MEDFLSCSGSLEDMKKKIIDDLTGSTSLKYLRCALVFYKGLLIETSNSRISFECKVNYGMTQISLKLCDGIEFMQMTTDSCFDTVSEDMQKEIIRFLIDLCHNAIDCINSRIPVVEEINIKQRKKDNTKLIIFMTVGFLLTIAYTMFPATTTVFRVMRLILALSGIVFTAKGCLIPLRWIWRD